VVCASSGRSIAVFGQGLPTSCRPMITSFLLLLAGVVLAWFGGSLFVDGAVGFAGWARWPVAVIGVTVAAFGTSSPELMVAIQSAVDGVPQIPLGDVLGSNVVNIALVLALGNCGPHEHTSSIQPMKRISTELISSLRSRIRGFNWMIMAMLLTILVGISRIYLGVHSPTDVLAGWIAGVGWALSCWAIIQYSRRRIGRLHLWQGVALAAKPQSQYVYAYRAGRWRGVALQHGGRPHAQSISAFPASWRTGAALL
jgi:membrane-associated phospholipid phosphatase